MAVMNAEAAAFEQEVVYKECRRNHAASLGKVSCDGCCEFLGGGGENNARDDMLCAACNCHRNFHHQYTIYFPVAQSSQLQVFSKYLTSTEINYKRLFFPSKSLGILPPFEEGRRDVKFYVSYGHDRPRLFRCLKRGGKGKDEYAKPTINIGWSDIVREKALSIGDKLMFHMEQNEPVRYRIEVHRKKSGVWIPIA